MGDASRVSWAPGAGRDFPHPPSRLPRGNRNERADNREIPRLIPGFQSVGRDAAHGIIILSLDHASGWVWLPGDKHPVQAISISVIGVPLAVFDTGRKK